MQPFLDDGQLHGTARRHTLLNTTQSLLGTIAALRHEHGMALDNLPDKLQQARQLLRSLEQDLLRAERAEPARLNPLPDLPP